MRTSIPANHRISRIAVPGRFLFKPASVALLSALAGWGVLVGSGLLAAAQEPAVHPAPNGPTATAPSKPAHPRKHAAAAGRQAVPVAAAPVPPAPVAPKPPDWPANGQPSAASVVWNSRGLRIEASNSSLRQILNDVATATGAKVEGMGTDQRIFGAYGPGPARDVLSQLLDGSGYNVMMVGDQGQGTPREILLSAAPQGPAPPPGPNQNSSNDENSQAEEQPQQLQPPPPPQMPNNFAPGAAPRTPQQIIQEMQQRQQQIEQMQQQQRTNPQ